MSRYIKTDALMEDIGSLYRDEDHTDYNVAIADALDVIDEQPTADVVEVVRCKDCKWFGDNECLDPRGLIWALGNNYCSLGERREDDEVH